MAPNTHARLVKDKSGATKAAAGRASKGLHTVDDTLEAILSQREGAAWWDM
eukprot:CAMPEP_0114119886 /NCGR_PEP_ID=MMETSP0043_2-20121206/6351_1 /TAXON_ID=464988 /ORGANISM="Hemiselmis andersenii, Strain CCMP644" /LENGTH=50 /DNA_ID=CAMNT_0001212465 /DNA_START=67 /DNA_END=219 /DNA_ORIENTATION=+